MKMGRNPGDIRDKWTSTGPEIPKYCVLYSTVKENM